MPIFKLEKDSLIKQKKIPFDLERTIQKLVEKNLPVLFNLEFVASELAYGKLRMDTLAFDVNQYSFVIIEYKNKADPGLAEQGLAYKALFKKHPEFFILEYNKKHTNSPIDKKDIDWNKTKILFLSPEFTKYLEEDMDADDVPFELWKISQYEGAMISLESVMSLPALEKQQTKEIQKERPLYKEEDHLVKPISEIKELYRELKKHILSLGEDVKVEPQKFYIAFKAATNFVDINLQKSALKCHINLSFGELNDAKQMARNVSGIGHRGNGDYQVILSKKQDIAYVVKLIKQSYEKNR